MPVCPLRTSIHHCRLSSSFSDNTAALFNNLYWSGNMTLDADDSMDSMFPHFSAT